MAQYTSCAAVANKAALGELAHEDDHAKLGLSSCGVPPRNMLSTPYSPECKHTYAGARTGELEVPWNRTTRSRTPAETL